MKHTKYLLMMIAACIVILLVNLGIPKALVSAVLFLETGRITTFYEPTAPTEEVLPQPTATDLPILPEILRFSEKDMGNIRMQYGCDYRPDLETLLIKPLSVRL